MAMVNPLPFLIIRIQMNKIIGLLLMVAALLGCSGKRSREGDQFFNKQQYQKAIDAYNDYLQVRPNDLKIIYKRGRAFEELGQDKEAISDYRFIISKDAEYADAHLSMGEFFYRTNDYESALFHYDKVLEKDKSNAVGYFQRGKTHQRLGSLKEAMGDYNTAISINGSMGEFYIARGSLRLVMNQKSIACNDFKIAKSLESKEADGIIKEYCR